MAGKEKIPEREESGRTQTEHIKECRGSFEPQHSFLKYYISLLGVTAG